MSDSYTTGDPHADTRGSSGTVDTAKAEAGALTDTARDRAGGVVDTAKGETKDVAREVKSQARSLYAQTTRELRDQAGTQQQRVASGLRSVSDELDEMASNSQNGGLASEFVRQASQRAAGAASWLGDRDPAGVVDEVKRFARRRPAVFIAGAAIAGIVVGRLTRALASEAASDDATDGSRSPDASRGSVQGAGASFPDTAQQGVGATGVDAADVPLAGAGATFPDTAGQAGYDELSDAGLGSAEATPVADADGGFDRGGDPSTGSLRREARPDVRPDAF